MDKKVLYAGIIIFAVVILGLMLAVTLNNQNKIEEPKKQSNSAFVGKETSRPGSENASKVQEVIKKESETTELEDGVLYSLKEKIVDRDAKADIIFKDNYYNAQIIDIMSYPEKYLGKVVEMEGMHFGSDDYTFVGKYLEHSHSEYHIEEYAYLRYAWYGDTIELKNKESWIKVIGRLYKGNDETSNNMDYYYILADSVQVMNKRGNDTVKN